MKKKLLKAMVVLGVLAVSSYGLYRLCFPQGIHRYYYPLGAEHRCDKQLWGALTAYAEKHGDAFPSGEATPEASISLIHTLDGYRSCGYLLHRRDVPIDVAQQMLDRGELLTPDTCGWNYVEGLRIDSDPWLALFWDKEGLGHNGERLSAGGHIVTFVNASSEYIPAARWDDFLDEQRELLAAERGKMLSDTRPRDSVLSH